MNYTALIDCDSFYVSCELIFQPWYRGRPVVVLSNNDGCVVSRSAEAKAIGIQMGAPYFQISHHLEQNNGKAFSSNYELYASLNFRIMKIIREYSDQVEIYSIDEAFITLERSRRLKKPYDVAAEIAYSVRKFTGVPVSIGVARTKTLAKLAGDRAKKREEKVYELASRPRIDQVLKETPVIDVWGINYRTTKKLNSAGIFTAADLRDIDTRRARKLITIVGSRIVLELQGIPCLPLELVSQKKKSITRSRSFGRPIQTLYELREAIKSHVAAAAAEMRSTRLVARTIGVYILTNSFRQDLPQYSNGHKIKLATTTDSSLELINAAMAALEKIYRPGYEYKKAGVYLEILSPTSAETIRLFEDENYLKEKRLMTAVDRINAIYGRHAIAFGTAPRRGAAWQMKRSMLSPRITTVITEIPVAKIS
jgi:DNA polymerase V